MDKSKETLTWKIKEENTAIKGAFSLTLATIIIKFLGLIYKLPLSNLLGDEGMGYFNSAYTAYAFFYLICTAGVPKAVMLLLSQEDHIENEKNKSILITISFNLYLILGIVVTLIFVLLSPVIAKLIGSAKSTMTMLAIAPSIIFVSLSGVLRGILTEKLNFLEIANSQIIEGVGKLAFGLAFAIIGTKSNMPKELISAFAILGVTLGSILGYIYICINSKIRYSMVKMGQISKTDKIATVKKLFSISVPITLSAAVMSLTNLIDLGMIVRNLMSIGYTETQAVSFFGNYTTLAVPMFNLAMSVITPISVAFMPIIARARNSRSITDIKDAESRSLELTALISAPIAFGLIIFSSEILSVLFKNSNIELGSILLILLSPAIVFSSVLLIVNTILEAAGFVKAPLISMLCGGIAKLIVSIVLIRNPRFGISGAPIGTVISYAAALLASLLIHQIKLGGGLPIISKYFKCYCLAGLSVFLAKNVYSPLHHILGNFVSLTVAILLAASTYFSIYFIIFGRNKKNHNQLAYFTNFSA